MVLGPEIAQQTTEKVKLIREKMKESQDRQKSYHDKRRKDLEFQEGAAGESLTWELESKMREFYPELLGQCTFTRT